MKEAHEIQLNDVCKEQREALEQAKTEAVNA